MDVTFLNFEARRDAPSLVEQSERAYHDRISGIARRIDRSKREQKLVLIAGPSASGKTTTSVLLRRKLEKMGVNAERISLDNFFLPKDQAPLLPSGEKDFETVHALDLEQLHRCFRELVTDKRTTIPLFDFKLGRENGRHPIEITNDILIVEGIHALNPLIIPPELAGSFRKIYISVTTEFSWEGRTVLTPVDLRLMRRLLRDLSGRNAALTETLAMWENVMAGERRFIQPYMGEADDVIDSVHLYEPLLYHRLLLPLLPRGLEGEQGRRFADLGKCLEQFGSLEPSLLPADSLIREFI